MRRSVFRQTIQKSLKKIINVYQTWIIKIMRRERCKVTFFSIVRQPSRFLDHPQLKYARTTKLCRLYSKPRKCNDRSRFRWYCSKRANTLIVRSLSQILDLPSCLFQLFLWATLHRTSSRFEPKKIIVNF